MLRKLKILILLVSFTYVFVKAAEEIKPNINEGFLNYLKSVADNVDVDVAVILTRAKYYDDGTVAQMDSLAFSSARKNDNFRISTLAEGNIENLVTDAEDESVLISLFNEKLHSNGKFKANKFGTDKLSPPETAAANVVLNKDGFEEGLRIAVDETLDLTLTEGKIEILEYFDNGNLKRNRTTNVHPIPVYIHQIGKMSGPMRRKAKPRIIKIIKKAYKIDVEDRTKIIAGLLQHDSDLSDYDWQVLGNVTFHKIKHDAQIIVSIGTDQYNLIGVKN